MLVIHAPLGCAVGILLFEPVVTAVVRDFQDLIGHGEIADLAGARVLRLKRAVVIHGPAAHRALIGHALVATNGTQGLAGRQPLTDTVGNFLAVAHRFGASLAVGAHV